LRAVAQTDVRVSREPTGIHLEFRGVSRDSGCWGWSRRESVGELSPAQR